MLSLSTPHQSRKRFENINTLTLMSYGKSRLHNPLKKSHVPRMYAHMWTLINNPVWLAVIFFRRFAHMDICWRTMPLLVQRPAVSSPEAPPGISVRTFFEKQLALAPVACVPKNHGFSGDPTNICPFLDTISYFPFFSVDKTCTIVAKFQACCPPTTLVRK